MFALLWYFDQSVEADVAVTINGAPLQGRLRGTLRRGLLSGVLN